MKLSTLYLVYSLSTVAAIGMPFAMAGLDKAKRAATPVNSEAALETTPSLQDTARDISLPLCSTPDGTDFFGDGTIAADGRTRAEFKTPIGGELSSCAGSADGVLTVGWDSNNKSLLRAYSPNGRLRWSASAAQVRSRWAIGQDGSAYIVVQGGTDTVLVAGYRPDGSRRWSVPVGRETTRAPVIGGDGNIYAYVSGLDTHYGELVAIAPDGKERWRTKVDGGFDGTGDLLASADGTIYVKAYNAVVAVGDGGVERWRFADSNVVNWEGKDLGSDGRMSLASDGTLYVAHRFLYALDARGAVKWTFKAERTFTDNDHFEGAPVVAADGRVYALTGFGQLYAVAADGRKLWMVALHYPILGSSEMQEISLTGDGRLLTKNGWLRVPRGMATGGWPAADRDLTRARRQEPGR
jgi:outer membrane protein assembly factor BamB